MSRIVAMARFAAGCLLLAVAWAGPLAAQSNMPDLTGTWVLAVGEMRTPKGVLDEQQRGATELVITEQAGGTFAGLYRWDRPDSDGHFDDGKTVTNAAEEAFLGVISWDGTSFIMVDHPDSSVRMGRLINDRTMETVLFESGPHAFVNRQIYVRQP